MSLEHKEYITKEGQEFRCSIYFDKAGTYMSDYTQHPSGYTLIVTPVKRSTLEGGFQMEEMGAFTGFRKHILEAERRSKKKLEAAIAAAQDLKMQMIDKILENQKEKI